VKYDPFDAQPVALTAEQRDYLEQWCRRQADRLGLRDWAIHVSHHGPTIEGSWAESHLRDSSEETWIAVSRTFLKDHDAEQQRHSLTHELLHCHFQPITRLAERLVASELGNRTESILDLAVSITEERAIDRLAGAVAQFLEPVAVPA
jgi:hypothetical protein